jgi:signal transduction histidine kinase
VFLSNAKEDTAAILSNRQLLQYPYDSLTRLANHFSISNLPLSLAYIDAAIAQTKNDKNFKKHFDAIRLKGLIFEDNKDYKSAAQQYQIAEVFANRISASEQNTIYTDLAIAYRKDGQYQLSQEYHNKVLHLALQTNDLAGIENSYDGLGTLFSLADDYDNAVKNYLKSLQYAEARNNKNGAIISLKNISDCYRRMQDYQLALLNIEKAYKLASTFANEKHTEYDEKVALIEVLNKYGEILGETKHFNEAFQKLDEGLAICKRDNQLTEKKHSLLMTKGDLFIRQDNFEEAEKVYLECLKNQNNLSIYSISKLNYELGNIYFHKNNTQKSLGFLKNSLKISTKYDFLLLSEMNHRKMYEIYKSKNQLKDALEHFEIANIMRDSIFNQEKMKRVSELQFRYQLEKSDKEIQSLRLRENNFLLYASVGIFGLALIFMLYIIYMRGQTYKELKHKTEEIEHKNKKLEETNQVLHQFAYASAHDLKEPLRTIGSFVTLIQRKYGKLLPEEANEYMTYVTGGVKKMNNLLEDLLQYSTLTMNGKEIIKEDVKLEEVVREITQNLQSAIESKSAVVNYPEKMPEVYMSRLHTTQLLQNLISNALKFVIDTPMITIDSKEDKESVLITVQDNGIGIKKEYSDKIFNLFQRLNKNDQRFEGTGLGLAICKNIVDKYNGKIWFESIENQGTKFFINIPKIAA